MSLEQQELFPELATLSDPTPDNSETSSERPATFLLDEMQCYLAAQQIPNLKVALERRDSFALKQLTTQEQIRALLFVVSICDKLNWDFTLGHLCESLFSETNGFDLEGISLLTHNRFRRAFGNYRREDSIDYAKKLRNLQELGRYFAENAPALCDIFQCESVSGEDGALALLKSLPVYREDPISKKANAFLHEVQRRQLLTFEDPNTIEPAIDYHIMRFYLRTGRVYVNETEMRERLISRRYVRIEKITELRKVVAEALCYTAWLSRVSVSEINDIEWAYARVACRRNTTYCTSADKSCVIDAICPCAGVTPLEIVTEPNSNHGHY